MTANLDVTVVTGILEWLPDRCRFALMGCDAALTSAIVTARPEARLVTSAAHNADVDVVISYPEYDILQLSAARALLRPGGHLLLIAPLRDPLLPVVIAARVDQVDGGRVIGMQKAGAAALYVVGWPRRAL